MPAILKRTTQFYTENHNAFEEDCEWSRVACAFPQYFPEEQDHAQNILKEYHPDIFAEWEAQGKPTSTQENDNHPCNQNLKEIGMNKLITRNCQNGQSIYNVLDELKAEGKIPQTATVDAFKRYQYGGEKNDGSIIGIITVRVNEMFAITNA